MIPLLHCVRPHGAPTGTAPLAGVTVAYTRIAGLLACAALCALVAACAGKPAPSTTQKSANEAFATRYPGVVKIGKPYKINNKWYAPAYNPTYDEEGLASWYGPGFHGKPTASGEPFDQHAMTAAHPTLPLPSFIHVTNMDNNKEAVLRVNDRGPFSKNRILDVSRAAAVHLGMIGPGTARLRVRYLSDETEAHLAGLLEQRRGRGGSAPPVGYAATPPSPAATAPVSVATVTAAPVAPVVASVEVPPASITQHASAPQATSSSSIGYAGGGYYVQAGVFRSVANAQGLRDRLQRSLPAGVPVHLDTLALNGETMHRVRIGPSPDSIRAQEHKSLVVAFGIPDARVVQD